MATGGHGQARRAFASSEHAGADAIVELLVRALRLERAALYLVDDDGQPVPVAVRGAVAADPAAPDGWSCVLPVRAADGTAGRLCLARPGGRPLAAADRALVTRLVDAAGDVLAARRDDEEREEHDERLARADRLSALGMLAAGIAHEIRNPLVSVRTFVELVPERLQDDEFLTGFRGLALAEIERICELVADLLALSRPAPSPRDAVDLHHVAEQIVRLLDAEARKREVTLRLHGPAAPCVVVGDEARLKQVVLNVVLNAIQAAPERGAVDVATRVDDAAGGRWAVVDVDDDGPGIAPAHVARVFEPFWTTKDGGSGLGLFVASRIVRDHDGSIAFVPRPERGTRCAVRLPAEPA